METVSFTLTITTELNEKLKQLANKDKRSKNNQIAYLLEKVILNNNIADDIKQSFVMEK